MTGHVNLASMTLNDIALKWEDRIKYLGVTLLSDKNVNIDLEEVRRKFLLV